MPTPHHESFMKELLPVRRIVALGGGAFGTALSLAMARKCPDCKINVWVVDKKEADKIEADRENTIYLKGFPLPPNIHYTSDCVGAIQSLEREGPIDLIIVTVPVQFMSGFFTKFGKNFPKGVPIVLASKGVCMKTLRFPYEIASESLPHEVSGNLSVAAGASFAAEIARNDITAITVGAPDIDLARKVQRLMSTYDGHFRLYSTTDYMGQEVAAATKNVYAILSGAAQGYGLGFNARYALLTRATKEMGRVMRAKGSSGESLGGLSGIGDLMMTASSEQSRNFTVGFRLGKGESYPDIRKSMKAVSEGVPTAKALHLLSKKLGIQDKLPLANACYRLIYEGASVEELISTIIHKPLTDELRGFPLPAQKHSNSHL